MAQKEEAFFNNSSEKEKKLKQVEKIQVCFC